MLFFFKLKVLKYLLGFVCASGGNQNYSFIIVIVLIDFNKRKRFQSFNFSNLN